MSHQTYLLAIMGSWHSGAARHVILNMCGPSPQGRCAQGNFLRLQDNHICRLTLFAIFANESNSFSMKTEYEKCIAGEPFIGGKDPKIVEMILRTRRLLAELNSTDYEDTQRRQALLREMFGSMGRGVHVDIDFHCEYGKHIYIGDKVIINMNCTFVDNNRIDIGNDVLIASNVQIYTATHSTEVNERMVQDWSEGDEICRTYALPVKIEDGVWIGGGAIILPGVTIGRNSVIGAGSVVTRSIPADCVAVGNPCRVIRQL